MKRSFSWSKCCDESFLLLKRKNDRHVVGKNEEVSGLCHVLAMFHCFVNRQELPCFNATMSFLQKKAIYCYVFCNLSFSVVHPCRKKCP